MGPVPFFEAVAMRCCWASLVMGMVWWAGICHAALTTAPTTAPTTGPTTREVGLFEEGRVWTMHLKVTGKQWEMMQPTRGTRLAFLLGVARDELPTTQPTGRATTQAVASTTKANGKPKEEAVEGRRMAPVAFGYEYAYVKATMELDGEVVKEVGLRFKGNGSYNSSAWLRRPMKVSLDHFVEGQQVRGVSEVNLHDMAVDPSYLREALAYQVYREAGVPAVRTAFALMYLTIEGQCEGQFLGLYTLVEEVDQEFLKERFGDNQGLLLKPDGIRNLPYLGEDWGEYGRYRAKGEGTEELRRRLIEFTKLLHYGDDETFVGEIRSRLDVDGFLRYLAVCTLESDMDSFLTASHNFYLYVHPADGRVHFMPWDMHLAFGGTSSEANPEQAVHLSVEKPYPGTNLLIQRVLMIEGYRRLFEGYLKEFSQGCFAPEKMARDIDRMQKAVKLAEEAERKPVVVRGVTTRPTSMPARPLRSMPELRRYVARRVESVLGQLEGKVAGWVPGERRPEGPPPLPPPPRMINPPPPPQPRVNRRGETRPARAEGRLGGALRSAVGVATTQASAATRPVGGARAAAGARQNAATQPVLVMRVERVIPERVAPRAGNRRGMRRVEAGAPLVLRAIDSDRSNGLTMGEVTDAVRVLYYAAGARNGDGGKGLDEGAIARELDRMGDLMDVGRVAPLGSGGAARASETSVEWGKVLVKEADGNGDGRVTLGEAIAMTKKWFGKADGSGDGVLSQRELAEVMDGMGK